MAADPVTLPTTDGVGAFIAGVAIELTLAAAAGLIHFYGSEPGERSVTGPWGSIAFAAVIATPAVLAVIGRSGRPWVLGAAGVVLLPMMLLSFSPLFFPLLAPAIIFIIRAASRRRIEPRARLQPVVAVVSGLLLMGAVACLLVHQDPITWSTPTGGSGSSSDVVTATEAFLAFALLGGAVVVAAVAPPDGRRRTASTASSRPRG